MKETLSIEQISTEQIFQVTLSTEQIFLLHRIFNWVADGCGWKLKHLKDHQNER